METKKDQSRKIKKKGYPNYHSFIKPELIKEFFQKKKQRKKIILFTSIFTALAFVIITFIGVNTVFVKNKVAQKTIDSQKVFTQKTQVIAGKATKWIKIVPIKEITKDKNLLKLPKTAKNIVVKIVSVKPEIEQQELTVQDGQQIVALVQQTRRVEKSRPIRLLASILNFFKKSIAGLDEAIDQLISLPAEDPPNIIETKDAIFVDVASVLEQIQDTSKQEKAEPASAEVTAGKQEQKEQEKEEKQQEKESEKETKKEEEQRDPASLISPPTEDLLETTSPSDQPVIEAPVGDIPLLDLQPQETPAIEEERGVEEVVEEPIAEQELPLEEEYIVIEYETPAPQITEQETDTGKLVTVSAPDELEYIDVLTFTNIPEIFKVGQESKIKIKWQNNNNQDVQFNAYDLNNNGKLDYVEWTVPHLSDQIFQIIFISKAFQLDSSQNIIADIYDQTQAEDNNWASLTDGQYARVTFNSILDNARDNTIYARPTDPSQPAQIEVYPVYTDQDGNTTEGPLIATFDNIDQENTYRVLLTNLQQPTDVFDLKIIGNVDIDYIVDPTTFTWDGGGANANWTTAGNWVGDVAPTGDGTESLVFSGATQTSTTNDFANGTTFVSISITAANFTLAGNSVLVTTTVSDSANSSGTVTISLVIGGACAVNKTNGYYFVLSGANTYTGLTTVSGGGLGITNATALGTTDSGTIVANGAYLEPSGTITVAEPITINGTGSGSMGAISNQTNNNTWSGLITLGSNASIVASNSTTLTISTGISNAGYTFTASPGATVDVTGVISGAGGLTKDGGGSLFLRGANTYLGDTTILRGEVIVYNNVSASTDGPLGNSANDIIIGNTTGTTTAYLLIGGTYEISRSITVQAGSSGGAYLGGGAAGTSTFSGNITLNKSTLYLYNVGANSGSIFSGVISGNYNVGVTKGSSSALGVTISGANTYTGTTTILTGGVQVNNDVLVSTNGPLGNSAGAIIVGDTTGSYDVGLFTGGAYTIARPITVQTGNTGTMTIGGNTADSSTFSGAITLAKAAIFAPATGGTVTYSGIISESGAGGYAVTKSGTGTAIFSGANTYTGATAITGKLNIQNNSALGTGAVTVGSNSGLQLQGGITVANALTINTDGSAAVGSLRNISGNNNWQGTITTSLSTRINSDSGTLTISTGGITRNLYSYNRRGG